MMTWSDVRRHGLPTNCKAVVNTAGENIFNVKKKWTEDFQQEVITSRLYTTSVLAKAINGAEKKPEAFVCMSGVGYYKPSQTAEYTEESPGGDFDFLSELSTNWEKCSELKPEAKEVRRVIIRSGIVLGRQGGVIRDMYFPFYFGVGGPVGSGQQFFPWIHINDIVGLILFAIENNKVKGVLNGVAPQAVTNREFATALGKAMWRPSLFPLPKFVLNVIFSPERAKIMTEGQKVIPKRALEYGFTYDYPDIDSACRACAHLTYTEHGIY
ncbi:unnamed protein product [Allacma fusca]|nr:unnamed protein product [Allacma fusca]